MFSSVSGSSNSNTTSSVGKGIGGLVSGIDTDSLVESMTLGTSNKIDKQKQEKQLLTWKQEAYRTMTKALMEFDDKYFFYASSTNITSPSFFEAYKVNNLSSKIGLSGKLQNASYVQVNSIDQLATRGKYTYKSNDLTSVSGAFDRGDKIVGNLDGQSISINYDNKTYKLTFDSNFGKEWENSAKTPEAMKNALTQMMKDAGVDEKVSVDVDANGKISFKGDSGKKFTISGDSGVMETLGFGRTTEVAATSGTIASEAAYDVKTETQSFAERVSGKSITFYLDGVSKTIKLDDYDKENYPTNAVAWFKDNLNEKLKDAFGTRDGKPAVSFETNKADGTFKFVLADDTSTFALDKADAGILGEEGGVFRVKAQTSSKLNTSMTMSDIMNGKADGYGKLTLQAGTTGSKIKVWDAASKTEKEVTLTGSLDDAKNKLESLGYTVESGGTFGDKIVITAKDTEKSYITSSDSATGEFDKEIYKMSINNVDFTFRGSDSLSKVLSRVSQSDAGVNMTYSSMTGSFVLEAKNYGNAEKIEIGTEGIMAETFFGVTKGMDTAGGQKKDGKVNLLTTADGDLPAGAERQEGKNSISVMTINGETKRIERASNIITIDGLNIELRETHTGTKQKVDSSGNPILGADGKPETEPDPISFNVALDSDSVVEKLKEFIDTYNGLIKTINTAITTKQDKDNKYEPLTDKQKEEMSESEIEKWEKEAKKSVLFNDSALRSVLQSMRSALYGGVEGVNTALSAIGITTGTYDKNGQLQLDEAKFRKALSDDPDKVTALFTQQSDVDYSPDMTSAEKNQRYKESGLMYRFQDILKGAVGTTTPKGTLLQIAGIEDDRTASDNQLTKKINDIDEMIKKLQKQLKTEQTRIWNKFTAMEKYIQQMNQQSESLLSQFQ